MNPNWIVFSLLVLLAYFNAPCNAEVRRILLRPMTGNEVYKVLQDAGREDAIPEGRVITQGIAAATGLGLGIIKGVGGSILFDLATSNETQQYLSNLMSGWFVQNGNNNSTSTGGQQEICFTSRSLNEIDDEYDEELSRQITTGTTGNVEEAEIEPVAEGRQATSPTTTSTTPNTEDMPPSTPTYTILPSSPTSLPTSSSSPSSSPATMTSPSSGGGIINCIVINKQGARKRRRRSLNNKLIKHTRSSKRYSRKS